MTDMTRKHLLLIVACTLLLLVSGEVDWTHHPVYIFSENNESLAWGYHPSDPAKMYVVSDKQFPIVQLRAVDGLAGGATVSFQKKDDKTKYLCPSGGFMMMRTEENNAAFKMAASFFETSPLDGGKGLSYESVENFDYFIHYNSQGQLRVDQWVDEPIYAKRASWKPHFAEISVKF